jgi:hypothetical protein
MGVTWCLVLVRLTNTYVVDLEQLTLSLSAEPSRAVTAYPTSEVGKSQKVPVPVPDFTCDYNCKIVPAKTALIGRNLLPVPLSKQQNRHAVCGWHVVTMIQSLQRTAKKLLYQLPCISYETIASFSSTVRLQIAETTPTRWFVLESQE